MTCWEPTRPIVRPTALKKGPKQFSKRWTKTTTATLRKRSSWKAAYKTKSSRKCSPQAPKAAKAETLRARASSYNYSFARDNPIGASLPRFMYIQLYTLVSTYYFYKYACVCSNSLSLDSFRFQQWLCLRRFGVAVCSIYLCPPCTVNEESPLLYSYSVEQKKVFSRSCINTVPMLRKCSILILGLSIFSLSHLLNNKAFFSYIRMHNNLNRSSYDDDGSARWARRPGRRSIHPAEGRSNIVSLLVFERRSGSATNLFL